MNINNLKSDIIKFLKNKGDYQNIDETLIQEYIANVEFCIEARKEIKKSGMILKETRIGKGGSSYEILKKNSAFDIYNKALDNMKNIVSKLGISPSDRIKLKLLNVEADEDDLSEFD